jgi:antitoxin component of MazEF toxin-antitoxin module
MVKNLIKHGNSYAVIIDKPILDLLRITPGTPLELTSDGRSILLSPVRDSVDGRAFEDAVDRLHARFGDTMRKLVD